MIYELKRYKVHPGMQEDFLAIWRPIVALRKKHGFHVLFAFFERESGWFTWAIGHEDFDNAKDRYYADPDRVALDRVVDFVGDFEIKRVEYMPIP